MAEVTYCSDYEAVTGKEREVETKVIAPPAAVKVAKPTAARVK